MVAPEVVVAEASQGFSTARPMTTTASPRGLPRSQAGGVLRVPFPRLKLCQVLEHWPPHILGTWVHLLLWCPTPELFQCPALPDILALAIALSGMITLSLNSVERSSWQRSCALRLCCLLCQSYLLAFLSLGSPCFLTFSFA